ncbi:MAG: hypothetical protein WD970_00275 [Patescibacteria group bacterium]
MGRKKLSKVNVRWSEQFAYAIGLITTDGNLSPDLRHINFTSKDLELVKKFKSALMLSNKIGNKSRGGEQEKKYYVIQFGDVNFFNYLLRIGLTPAKSLTLEKIRIPDNFFCHFLRGCIDGDGNVSVVYHPESKHPQLRLRIYSSSPTFLSWMHATIKMLFDVSGGWIDTRNYRNICTLVFAKHDARTILTQVYKTNSQYRLERKYVIARPFLGG